MHGRLRRMRVRSPRIIHCQCNHARLSTRRECTASCLSCSNCYVKLDGQARSWTYHCQPRRQNRLLLGTQIEVDVETNCSSARVQPERALHSLVTEQRSPFYSLFLQCHYGEAETPMGTGLRMTGHYKETEDHFTPYGRDELVLKGISPVHVHCTVHAHGETGCTRKCLGAHAQPRDQKTPMFCRSEKVDSSTWQMASIIRSNGSAFARERAFFTNADPAGDHCHRSRELNLKSNPRQN